MNKINTANTETLIEEIRNELLNSGREKFVILLMGQTGRGKSSTINSLLGKDIAPVNDFEPQTMKIETYFAEINGVKVEIIDTPGLCDDLEEKGNDAEYIDRIKSEIKQFDCLWFVSRLDETRVTNDEKRAVKIITEAFGHGVWNHALIVFTFAGKVESEYYTHTFNKRTELIKRVIEYFSDTKIANDVESVAVDNKKQLLPNGKEWLGELYTKTFLRIKGKGIAPFLLITAHRLSINEPTYSSSSSDFSKSRINLTTKQATTIKDAVVAGAGLGFSLGAKMGMFLGPGTALTFGATGAVIGGAVGGVIKFFGKLFS